MMRRILGAALASLLLYGVAFGLVLDRPLSLGFLRQQIEAKLARGAALPSPKLVILAGSNAPYSHRCETMEPILEMPCVNAGVAVGIGLDYLFARWRPLLHEGDIVYLPMEQEQYVRPQAATALGPDAGIMLRHDRATLFRLPMARWLAALFSTDLRGAVMSLIETGLAVRGFDDPRAATTGRTNAQGDHVGHTEALARASRPVLAAARPTHVGAAAIEQGDGTALIAGFIVWARAQGIHVVGGLPTGFADMPLPAATVEAIRAVYLRSGAAFLELPNQSRYPRAAFFDTPEHLNEPAQIAHSRLVATALLRGEVEGHWDRDAAPTRGGPDQWVQFSGRP
ncbi:MAG: hypothetical protein BGO51_13675 [Rhodospirillales bacterium 69-11]|nr:hypothetical protein [Rhodospirillales bacterium]MBN8925519.1 hypothetical protein [Rhodospirillales bacterium]OJW26380.1 MAG: hypothetical protein BGO51_13675 [Rhodospirillales bacterium 69-11]